MEAEGHKRRFRVAMNSLDVLRAVHVGGALNEIAERVFRCPQCHQVYENPHTLPCHCILCWSCLSHAIASHAPCPQCTKPFWLKDVCANPLLSNIVEKFRVFVRTSKTDDARLRVAAEALLEEITCPVCLSLLDDPHALNCNHMFCRDCLSPALENDPRCPVCKAPATKRCLTPQAIVAKVVSSCRWLRSAIDLENGVGQGHISWAGSLPRPPPPTYYEKFQPIDFEREAQRQQEEEDCCLTIPEEQDEGEWRPHGARRSRPGTEERSKKKPKDEKKNGLRYRSECTLADIIRLGLLGPENIVCCRGIQGRAQPDGRIIETVAEEEIITHSSLSTFALSVFVRTGAASGTRVSGWFTVFDQKKRKLKDIRALAEAELGLTANSSMPQQKGDANGTRCPCGSSSCFGMMIQCDFCETWQHMECMGIQENEVPSLYLCDLCRTARARPQAPRKRRVPLSRLKLPDLVRRGALGPTNAVVCRGVKGIVNPDGTIMECANAEPTIHGSLSAFATAVFRRKGSPETANFSGWRVCRTEKGELLDVLRSACANAM
eukprot:TRINITY_DN3518_c1_g2_i1.p1 TRINITY_DN3518_c1_g2~~TRINITY_DN3518_c1_g2_i1.p1  ORF type:complete len:633 (+),score=142.23 TRINITY_DN3518_c1_g2_i1:253-1899(+)